MSSHMLPFCRYTLEEVFPFVGPKANKVLFETKRGDFYVKVSSPRLQCFKRDQSCVRCRRPGNVFILETHKQNSPRVSHNCFVHNCPWCAMRPRNHDQRVTPHLNLYHEDSKGKLILMTQDHIHPKSAGGSNDLHNLQTMCSQCNQFKAAMLPDDYEKVMLPHERDNYRRTMAR